MAAEDFGGWAKLTCQDAAEIATIVARFSPRTVEERTRMLLVLFASQSRGGTVDVGYRTLAERAGVTVGKAKRFMARLKDEGILVDVGTVKNRVGEFTVRRFDWVEGGGSEKRPTLGSKTPMKSTHPGVKTPHKIDPHQSSQRTQIGAADGRLAPATSSQEQLDAFEAAMAAHVAKLNQAKKEGGTDGV